MNVESGNLETLHKSAAGDLSNRHLFSGDQAQPADPTPHEEKQGASSRFMFELKRKAPVSSHPCDTYHTQHDP